MSRLLWLALFQLLVVTYAGSERPDQASREKLAETGGDFLKTCAIVEKPTKRLSSSELLDANYCAAYMTGFVDALQVAAELYQEPLACFPEAAIDVRETTKLVLAYIRERPERSRRTTAVLVGAALARAFPCRK